MNLKNIINEEYQKFLNKQLVLNEDFKSMKALYLKQGIDSKIIDNYINTFKTIKDFRELNDFKIDKGNDWKIIDNVDNNDEQKIIDDILSIDEGVGGDMLQKIKDYGKKWLLTATIILAVAFSSQAQQQNKTDDVIKIGLENADTTTQKLVYCAYIGMVTEAIDNSFKKVDVDAVTALQELAIHFENLRDGKTPIKLSSNAFKYFNILHDVSKQLDKRQIDRFIEKGKTITHSNKDIKRKWVMVDNEWKSIMYVD